MWGMTKGQKILFAGVFGFSIICLLIGYFNQGEPQGGD